MADLNQQYPVTSLQSSIQRGMANGRTRASAWLPSATQRAVEGDGVEQTRHLKLQKILLRGVKVLLREENIHVAVHALPIPRLGEVETIEYQRDRGMGVTVYRGKRKGSASTGDLSASAIRDTVAKAFSIAVFTRVVMVVSSIVSPIVLPHPATSGVATSITAPAASTRRGSPDGSSGARSPSGCHDIASAREAA